MRVRRGAQGGQVPPPSPAPIAAQYYILGTDGAFTWTNPGGPDDNIAKYIIDIGTTPGGNDLLDNAEVTDGSNTINFTGSFGTTYYATITSVSAADVSAIASGSSDTGAANPNSNTSPIIILDPAGDQDGDGQHGPPEGGLTQGSLPGSSLPACPGRPRHLSRQDAGEDAVADAENSVVDHEEAAEADGTA